MPHKTLAHGTRVIEKTYAASPAAVFAAWADPVARAEWGSPSSDIVLKMEAADFSEGGRDLTHCMGGDEVFATVVTQYHNIVANSRIVLTETISSEGMAQGASLVSAEFLPDGRGTRLVLTLQTAAFDSSDLLEGVLQGWESALESLGETAARFAA